MRTCALFLECRNIIIGQVDDAAQGIQRLLHVIDLFGHHFDLVNGAVQGERNTVTIIDNAAAGGDGHQLDSVFIRASLVIGKTDDL